MQKRTILYFVVVFVLIGIMLISTHGARKQWSITNVSAYAWAEKLLTEPNLNREAITGILSNRSFSITTYPNPSQTPYESIVEMATTFSGNKQINKVYQIKKDGVVVGFYSTFVSGGQLKVVEWEGDSSSVKRKLSWVIVLEKGKSYF